MKFSQVFFSLLLMLLLFHTEESHGQYYQYTKPVRKDKVDIDHIAEFEFGLHSGRNWTIGSTRELAYSGQVYSLNMGSNNGKFYWGTEFNFKIWDEIFSDSKAREKEFSQKQFLWLFHMKWFIGKAKTQAFIGWGTDLLSITEAILSPKEEEREEDYYRNHRDRDRLLHYNAWFVPSFGVRYKFRPKIFADISYSIDLSENYNSMRLQVGIVYQL